MAAEVEEAPAEVAHTDETPAEEVPAEQAPIQPSCQIAFDSNRDGDFEIYVMDADGSNQQQLTFNDIDDMFPVWSPEGAQITFDSDRDGDFEIYVMDADGSNEQLTFNDIDDGYRKWSPDGAQITFDSDRDGDFEIYVMDADGSNEQLTFNSSVDEYPAWSPDGAQIAFDSNRDGDHEIYVMDADGSNQQQLTFNDSDDGFPAWSPEGAQIAFTSNRDGDWEIYIMDADGNNEEQLTTNDIDDGYPAWSPRCEGAPADSEDVPSSPSKLCQIDSAFREYWEIALCETFDSETTLWTGDQEGTSARIEGGQYILDNSTKVQQGYTTGFIFPVFAGSSQDHMISVDGTMESIYQGCTWGVFIRSESNEIVYFFMINNSGRYSLTGSSDNESSRYLGNIDSGSNSAIVGDGTNTITAVADGKQMEFYVNGELIITHEAINSENPHFGLIVWGGEGVTAVNRFDNLLVRTK